MSVFILGTADDSAWAETAARTVALAGVKARTLLAGDTHDDGDPDRLLVKATAADASLSVIGAVHADVTIILASSAVPLDLIDAAYATSFGQASRKIVDIGAAEAGDTAIQALFQIADMLIFTPQALAATLGLDAVPTDVDACLPVQALIARHNQGVVVRFPGHGSAAIWADRTMVVAASGSDDADSRALFGATIAAAVAQKIGPEMAMTMALTAAAFSADRIEGFQFTPA